MVDFPLKAVSRWHTRKGQTREVNQDAGGLYIGPRQMVAVVVDAAELGLFCAKYSRYWVKKILEAVQKYDFITYEVLIAEMHAIHATQSEVGFTVEIAAYAILVLDDENGSWAVNCGDCRIGNFMTPGKVEWLTPVHTAANFLGEEFTQSHAEMPRRHKITRKLRVRKFDTPALTQLDKIDSGCWLLGTDGYWINHSFRTESNEAHSEEDDASLLILAPSNMVMMRNSENFFIYKNSTCS